MRALPVLVFAASLAGCTASPFPTGGGSSSSSSSSGSAAHEPPVVTGYRSVYGALCDYFEHCKSTLGPAYSSVEACRTAQDTTILLGYGTYAQESLVYNVDQAALTACLSALSGAACADRVPPELIDCLSALSPVTPREPGASCSTRYEAGSPRCAHPRDTYCRVSSDGCGVCGARKDNGETCASNDECQTGYCNVVFIGPRTCAVIPSGKAEGEGCSDTLECRGNLVCAGPIFNKHCEKRVAAGESCSPERNGENPECVQDLQCKSGVCALRLADGEVCARNPGTGQGVCARVCAFLAPEAEMGVCTALRIPPGDGVACAYRRDGNTATPICAPGTFADERFTGTGNDRHAVSCECSAPLAGGSMCFKSDACQSGICTGATDATPGACRATSAVGVMCSGDGECQSGYCGAGDTCAAPPVCQ